MMRARSGARTHGADGLAQRHCGQLRMVHASACFAAFLPLLRFQLSAPPSISYLRKWVYVFDSEGKARVPVAVMLFSPAPLEKNGRDCSIKPCS